jgi:hypothetical protein
MTNSVQIRSMNAPRGLQWPYVLLRQFQCCRLETLNVGMTVHKAISVCRCESQIKASDGGVGQLPLHREKSQMAYQ